MIRDRALKAVLVIVGLMFVATAYPLLSMNLDESLQMMLSVYVTLGVFLLLAVRNPSAHRSLIAFAAWSSFAHAAVMTVQSRHDVAERMHFLIGSLALALICVALLVLMPTQRKVNASGFPKS